MPWLDLEAELEELFAAPGQLDPDAVTRLTASERKATLLLSPFRERDADERSRELQRAKWRYANRPESLAKRRASNRKAKLVTGRQAELDRARERYRTDPAYRERRLAAAAAARALARRKSV